MLKFASLALPLLILLPIHAQAKDVSAQQVGVEYAQGNLDQAEAEHKRNRAQLEESEKRFEAAKKALAEDKQKVATSQKAVDEAKAKLLRAQDLLDRAWKQP